MYVLRRTVGSSIDIDEGRIKLSLGGIDMLGGCVLLEVETETQKDLLELGAGERVQLDPQVLLHVLRIAISTYDGHPARVVEFGFEAPKSVLISRSEQLQT